jgi:transcriptional regulator with XRE-family HTH domain
MNRRLTVHKSPKQPRPDLAFLLRFLRQRIDPHARALGPYPRRCARLGKRVTQDELAEAIGVSREWYALLECGAARTRASTSLLDRLGDALMVTPDERGRLFHLAVPELGRVQLRDDSIAALQGFSRLRVLSKRLWAATSIDDVLTTASEQIADWFDDAVQVQTTLRRELVPWEHRSVDDRQDRNVVSKIVRDMKEVLLSSESGEMKELLRTSALYDALNLHPRLPNAGDVGTPDLWPLAVQREMPTVYARHRVGGFSGRYVRVRARSGFIGGFYIAHEFGHSYSASDHAVFGAFGELTSYALS